MLLFGRELEETPLDGPSIVEESGEELSTRRIVKKHMHGRNPLPDHLPRQEIEHDLPDAEKTCPCCGELRVRIAVGLSAICAHANSRRTYGDLQSVRSLHRRLVN